MQQQVSVPLWLTFISSLVIAIVGFAIWYLHIDAEDTKLLGLIGGITSGLIVYFATFVSVIRPLLQADHFKRMGVRDLLSNRHNKTYYRDLIKDCKTRVDVMGASCTRFVEDFLDVESEDRVLIEALNKYPKLKIRLLIPTNTKIGKSGRDRLKSIAPKLDKLKTQFNGRVEIRRFNSSATHSFVLTEEDLVAGPIFESDKSKHAPAVRVATWTRYGQKYAEYFDEVWDSSNVAG
ncbi:MAG: hypothetical protein AAGE37_00065 [Pseudomonadota bacterium]